MKKLILLILIFIHFNSSASIYIENATEKILITKLISIDDCFNNINGHHYPYLVSNIYSEVLNNEEERCYDNQQSILKKLNKRLYLNQRIFGVELNSGDLYFQDSSKRINDSNVYFVQTKFNENYSYKFKVSNDDGAASLDNSYISLFSKNHIVTIGKVNYWWSSSDEIALSLSNASMPFKSISLESINYRENKIMPILGPFSYKFFIGKLEKRRVIPNAKILGAKINFYPNQYFDFSISRTAQFGGKGRPEGLKSFLNLILGRDNRGSGSINIANEPGNQMASLNTNYYYLKNKDARLYFNISGQDEAGYLPSRIISNVGHEIYIGKYGIALTLDYTDTETRKIKNYSYNHGVYKSGWRHKAFPLGASIDGDSEMLVFKVKKDLKNNYTASIKLIDADINKNNNSLNYWSQEYFDLTAISLRANKKFSNGFAVSAIAQLNSSKINSIFDKNFYYINIEYNF